MDAIAAMVPFPQALSQQWLVFRERYRTIGATAEGESLLPQLFASADIWTVTVLATSGARKSVLPVYAAVRAASKREVVRLAEDAERAGASNLLLATSPCLPLSDAEERALFMAMDVATSLPICFYNEPVWPQFDVSPATQAFLAATSHVVVIKDTMTMQRDEVADRVSVLSDAVGPAVSIGLSSDLQLLDEQPEVDAWHSGPAGILPGDYVNVWRRARAGGPQEAGRKRLQGLAQALVGVPHQIGALHALSNVIGVPADGPRGSFATATQEETWELSAVIAR